MTTGATDAGRPLADRVRPAQLDDIVGQDHLLGPGRPLRRAIESGALHSMVLWGPPGVGKTTIARLVAVAARAELVAISAVLGGVKDIRAAVEQAIANQSRSATAARTVVFVDEVHRFNKAQQDAFLPHIEAGTITFVGATTENPAFELNNALLSRVRVYVLKSIERETLVALVARAAAAYEPALEVTADAREAIAALADGDARRALNLLEQAADFAAGDAIDGELIGQVSAGGITRRFDKGGDAFYDQISALHKATRGSDPDAALYWLARMLDGGCDPRYIARRVLRIASEDIGNADPRALRLALDACECFERLGSPEGELAIAQALVFCACAPKSNAVYRAFDAARADVAASGSLEVPPHVRNAASAIDRSLGHGRGYRYDHDCPGGHAAGQQYFPSELGQRRYYEPVDRGLEIQIAEKLARLRG